MSRLRNGDLAGVRILLVDDAPDALDVLATILRRAKADVTTAPSAADARRIASARSLAEPNVVAAASTRPGSRVVTSWNRQLLPSGSLNETHEP